MKRTNESGVALISAVLVVALMSALLVGFVSMVIADQNAGLHNRDQTTAYAAAHAGLEQLTSDLGELFATNFRPTSAQVNGADDDAAGAPRHHLRLAGRDLRVRDQFRQRRRVPPDGGDAADDQFGAVPGAAGQRHAVHD